MQDRHYVTLKQGDEIICDKYTVADLRHMEHKLWWATTMGLLTAAIVIFIVVIPNLRLAYTASGSMVPTISVGDLVLYRSVGDRDDIERGDIILFEPESPAADTRTVLTGSTVYYEKRVIGMPGERISIEDGVVYINGDPLYEPYKLLSIQKATYRDMEEICIPDGYYFVMGDNRDHSADSRVIGPIPYDTIRFTAIIIIPSLAGLLTGTNNDELFIDS